MHTFTERHTKHMSLPWTFLHPHTTELTASEVSPAEEVPKQSQDATTKLKSKRLSEIPVAGITTLSRGLLSRLQRAWNRSANFVFPQNDSEHNRSSRQRMSSGVLADPSSLLTHAKVKATTSVSLPATHSMTSTSNPTPSSLAHHTRGDSASPDSQKSSSNSSTSTSSSSYRIPLKIRDFTYQTPDPRHQGLGEDGRGTLNIPKENRVKVIYKLLLDDAGYQAWKQATIGPDSEPADSDGTDEDEDEDADENEFEDDDDDDERGWNGHWTMPSNDPNLDEEAEEEGPLSPGLYRALYSFEPEGSREMSLKEEQVVRVVGRGGGAGWAVVVVDGVDEEGNKRASQKEKQLALVPESYLEPIALDDEES